MNEPVNTELHSSNAQGVEDFSFSIAFTFSFSGFLIPSVLSQLNRSTATLEYPSPFFFPSLLRFFLRKICSPNFTEKPKRSMRDCLTRYENLLFFQPISCRRKNTVKIRDFRLLSLRIIFPFCISLAMRIDANFEIGSS